MDNETDLTGLTLEEGMKKLFKEGKIPELNTEIDIWKVIESLGGYIFYTEHDAADGRISLNSKSEKHLQIARKVSELIVNSLEEFDVIPLSKYPECEIGQKLPPAPKGKIYYWDWYNNMSTEYHSRKYNGILCSACPFVEENPVEAMRTRIPCSIFPGMAYQLFEPYRCAMVDMFTWDEEELYRRVQEKGGEDALKKFKQKIQDLKNKS